MPWSNGVYTRSNGVFTGATVWASDASVGTNITTSHHDTHDQDIATGLNNCVTVDGLNQIAANFVSTADGAYNLGSASFRWGNAYFAGNVTGGSYVNSTLASPTLSGTVIGTYTLGGTPTITSPTIATPTITNPTITNPTITNPTINGNSVINAAQGRLSLTSTTPVQITDVSGGTAVYYLPYSGPLVPSYNGTYLVDLDIGSGLGLALDGTSGHTGYQESGNNFDLFVFNNSGTVALGTGPAWSTATARGTGAGTTQLTQSVGGFWTNAVQIALKIDATATQVTVPANEATYVGTMYASANGQCTQQFKPTAASGGSANILGLWNAYNRLRITSLERDSTSNWSMDITNWGAADASASNKITWIDGLQQSFVEATSVELVTIGSTITASIGVGLNTITATPNVITEGGSVGSAVNNSQSLRVTENFPPQLGLNYISAMEFASASSTTVTAAGTYAYLQLSLEM